MIRVLTLDDYSAIRDVVSSRMNFIGVSEDQAEWHRDMSAARVRDLLSLGPSVGSVFGLFVENEMIAVIETCLSSAQPCYFIRKAHTKPDANVNSLSLMFEFIIKHYEERGFVRFYTLYRKADIGLYHRLWRTTHVLKNYLTYTDLEIPGNTRPKHSDYWELLCGRLLIPEVRTVRGFILKSESLYLNEERL